VIHIKHKIPWVQLTAIGLVAFGAVAILVQDHLGALPAGLFNTGRQAFAMASHAALFSCLALLVLLTIEQVRGRRHWLGDLARMGLVTLVLLELTLWGLDTWLASGRPDAPLGGPYQQVWTQSGEPVFLRKAHSGSRLGFRTSTPYSRHAAHPRVLMLGDSYTEGSGRAPACNYPDLVERKLAEHLGHEVEVLNAGVAGYGPRDSARLLTWLGERGFDYDVIVYSLFLENDFTDNLPGTERRVVAGMNFRYLRSAFLRVFHPLNTRTFRWTLFAATVGTLTPERAAASSRAEGECNLEPTPFGRKVPSGLRALVLQRLGANYGPSAYPQREVVADAVHGMAARANARDAPFVLVVFPDRIVEDAELRDALEIEGTPVDLLALRTFVHERFSAMLRIDTTEVLAAEPGMYRRVDTHLSDLGNVRAARWVAGRLADMVPVREALRAR